MFGISLTELLVIFIVVLLVYGPNELPAIAKKLGQLAGHFQRTATSVRREFFNAMYTPASEDVRRLQSELRAVKREVLDPPPPNTGEKRNE